MKVIIDNKIPYIINPTRPPAGAPFDPAGTTEDDLVRAVRNVFQTYENIGTSKLQFEFLGVDGYADALCFAMAPDEE